jgi:pimeloyl-ACP methyl ester carboxylesterase
MQEFSSGGVRIAYIDEAPVAGTPGEPILLVHGFASNHAVNWVFPQWIKTLTGGGRRVIAFDNRGHGRSEKLYRPQDYTMTLMANDARNLLDHLGIDRADVMGYSLGGRIATVVAESHPHRVRSLVLGGIGDNLVNSAGLGPRIAEAMEAPSVKAVDDPYARTFRAFADATKSDLKALAACCRGGSRRMTVEELAGIKMPVLVAVGTKDDVAGDPHRLAALFPAGRALAIPDRDHNRSVGDAAYKRGVMEFLGDRP